MGNNFSVESPSCDQPCLPFLCGKRKYLYNMEENLKALHKVMQDLNAMRNDLLKRVSKEEDIGLQGLQEVKGWISMVEEIEPKANRLLDESVSEIQRLSRYGYCSLIPASTYRYGKNVLMTLKGVKTLTSKGVFEVVVHRALPPLVIKMPPIQLTVSQQNLFEKACNFLEEKNVGTLGIYGKGGVGKTTLLTKIKNKFQEAFGGVVIFVVVGSEEVESIQEEISNRLDLQWGRETKEEKAAEIFMALMGKKFLLLLDGIQRQVDLGEIGVPFPSRENGCKIVFTTRSREACDESKWVDAKVEITCLSPEEAWDLFQEAVGVNTLRSHQDIPKLARVVASACRGLPLALNLIGETMSRKRTVREWRYTIHVLASSTAEFPDMEDGPLPILKSIYDNMSDENIRLCFLYCAPFPENCDIRREDLVNYWIGEGILAKEDRERTEIQGNEIICDLVRMRLLMEGGNGYCVKMHGMVREMALWIASEKIPQFRNIRTVTIHGCECLKELTWLFLAPCIRDLSLSECPLVEEVISKEKAMAKLGHTSEQPFQNLTKLVLNGLPKLKSIYWPPLPFPFLEYLEIRRCPELKRLPLNSESAVGNQVEMKIEEQWIKVVEWEDEATKQRFSHFSNRDFPQMAEDPKMDGLTSESHPIQNIDLVGTTVDSKENSSANSSGAKAVQTVSKRTTAPMSYGDIPEKLSLKDSLTAVRNATKAADRLHQVFRMQSFQRKQLSEFGDDEKIDISDNIAVSFAASKTKNPGHSDVSLSSAATHIQKKYRGWKKRKEFLLILQRIVKIQAHVRGHQVRKQYRTIIWSVGLLEKIILRWRRKGIGLRGFKRNAIAKTVETEPPVSAICPTIPQEDEYDFLKEGRKQTEERLQKALTRVKSMVQYPEARDQYRRLLTVVEGFRENEASSLVNCDEDDLIDILNDDTLMSISP